MRIFIGNLSFKASDDDLRAAFEAFGTVTSARVAREKDTGRSRGFGFVEMPDDAQGRKAIAALQDKDLAGRPMRPEEARAREERPSR